MGRRKSRLHRKGGTKRNISFLKINDNLRKQIVDKIAYREHMAAKITKEAIIAKDYENQTETLGYAVTLYQTIIEGRSAEPQSVQGQQDNIPATGTPQQ